MFMPYDLILSRAAKGERIMAKLLTKISYIR
jgi:hypothetical protein